jgi:hypothetical protein
MSVSHWQLDVDFAVHISVQKGSESVYLLYIPSALGSQSKQDPSSLCLDRGGVEFIPIDILIFLLKFPYHPACLVNN